MAEYKAKASGKKKESVKEFATLMKKYSVVAVADLEAMPTAQLTAMRKKLRNSVLIKMTKKPVMMLAMEKLKEEKPNIEKLKEHIKGSPALLFTNENPFKLFKILEKSKSKAAAKPGQKAPRDIIIPKGPTSFTPGPIISELASAGIKAGVEQGKIAIKEDKIIAKEGQVIDNKIATLLAKFNIMPMEIGLNVNAVYENGIIYTKDVLSIDENEFKNKISQASQSAFNLAIEISYPCAETINMLIQKAFANSRALSIEAGILTKDTANELLSRAEAQVIALKNKAGL